MARISHKTKALDYVAMRNASARYNEHNDCAVVALAVACNVEYEEAHAALAKQGRRNRRGTFFHHTVAAVKTLGFELEPINPRDFIDRYPGQQKTLKNVTTHHPDRFPKVWADGNTYLIQTDRHILAVKDGVNCDWTRGRAMRAKAIHKVVPKGEKKLNDADVTAAFMELTDKLNAEQHINNFMLGITYERARAESSSPPGTPSIIAMTQYVVSAERQIKRFNDMEANTVTRLLAELRDFKALLERYQGINL